jgi:glycosyltransferase involved in cell wall biosynthesis
MRIGLVFRVRWPGGVHRIALAEAEGLSRLGHIVDLVFIRDSSYQVEYPGSIAVRTLFGPGASRRRFAPFFRAVTKRFAPERGPEATVDLDLILSYEKHRPAYDVLIYGDPHTALFARAFRLFRKVPYLIHVHESAFKTASVLWRAEEKLTLSGADGLIASSNRTAETLRAHGFEFVHTIRPGLYVQAGLIPFSARQNDVVSATMWDRGRHPEVFIPIAERLDAGRIILAGSWADQNFRRAFSEKVIKLSLQERLVVTSTVSEPVLNDHYRSAKLAIRFGYNENGPGMGALEALAWGLPLIINKGIGIDEVARDQVNSIVVDESAPDTVVDWISKLINDERTWTRLSSNNLALARTMTWENHARELDQVVTQAGVGQRCGRSV